MQPVETIASTNKHEDSYDSVNLLHVKSADSFSTDASVKRP